MALPILSIRTLVVTLTLILLAALLLWGFRDPPVRVDVAEVHSGPFRITLSEEGRTRLADRFEVTAPITGHIDRVLLEPGDRIRPGDALFRIHPPASAPLDARSRAQAEAQLARAESSLSAARTQVAAEKARADLARTELERVEQLVNRGFLPSDALDRARAEAQQASALLRSARFSVDVARYERDNAEATLAVAGGSPAAEAITVSAPVSGVVLRKFRESEGAIQMGEPVLSLGNMASLEVEVDVLSSDAVRLRPGMTVELERWGGDGVLPGRVRRIEPSAFTKVSALGVDEQRVWVIVDLGQDIPEGLGDGFRVEALFVLDADEQVRQAPASAIFRDQDQWYSFVVRDGTAVRQSVEPGRLSGLTREILGGLAAGERVVVHPPSSLADGDRVEIRD